jgi:glycogen synthase
MNKPLRILFATPEAVPFAKTGGLADVAGALPKFLQALGCEVRLVMPYYRMVKDSKFPIISLDWKNSSTGNTFIAHPRAITSTMQSVSSSSQKQPSSSVTA